MVLGNFFEQRFLTLAELVSVLRHIGCRYFEQRFFIGVDIGLELAPPRFGELHTGWHTQNLAGKRGIVHPH